MNTETPCITCGLPSGDPPRLNHLPSGLICPSCHDRLLESLPPMLPVDSTSGIARESVPDEQIAFGGGIDEGWEAPGEGPIGPHRLDADGPSPA